MSRELGGRLPQALVAFLRAERPEAKFRRVLPLTTVDADATPRHALLSPFEVTAADPERLCLLVYATSHTRDNLARGGPASLMVVDAAICCYVYGRPRALDVQLTPREQVFELRVERVAEDTLPTARIVTGITFSGYDPGTSLEERRAVFRRLLSLGPGAEER
jgi:hypothetical protein